MCDEYLITFHRDDIRTILRDEDTTKHFSININFIVLYEYQPNLVLELLEEPDKCLEDWDKATLKAQLALLKEVDTEAQLKSNVHCRLFQLPGLSAVRRTVFPGNDDAGKFMQISGTVMRMSVAKLLEYQRNYVCVKCKYPMLVKAEYEKKYIIKQPKKCGNPEKCPGTNLVTFGELDSENCKDYQEIKIQEQVRKVGVGSMPNTMWVTLEDDLVDSCKPGDNVTITGIVKRRWGEFCKGHKIDIDIVFKANNLQVDNNSSSLAASTPEIKEMFNKFWEKYADNPLAGRDFILNSFCPQIYGLYLVKLAIAVVLAGGSQVEDTKLTGVHTRSESHLLLVGDPGTGKSQLLRFASKIIPRSVLTTGVGSTAAGLTVTAIMEHGEWQLEGGALVMSDGGICCIDEFNSMKEHDRTSLHEAMEQQTISVAKASIVCKLNTRCSILAACNPKGNLDPTQPLCMNIALPSPLLSRFDLILLLRDTVNEEWDTQLADYILSGGNHFSQLTDRSLWSVDLLQAYFTVIKKLNPKLSNNAEIILSTYYQVQRRVDGRNKARTTVRLLESLVRLSQGHARLMSHKEVETIDSVYAIILVDAAMDSESSILNLNFNAHSVFPECPSRDYRTMLERVLTKLQLQDILDKEIVSLNQRRDAIRSRFFNMHDRMDEIEIGGNSGEQIEQGINLVENSGTNNVSTEIADIIVHETSKFNTNVPKNSGNKKRFRKENVQENMHRIDVIADINNDFNDNLNNTENIQIVEDVAYNSKESVKVKPGTSKSKAKKKKSAIDENVCDNAKKVRKPIDASDISNNFDEGYDTASFNTSSASKNSANKKSATKRTNSAKKKIADAEDVSCMDFSETGSSREKEVSSGNILSCNSKASANILIGDEVTKNTVTKNVAPFNVDIAKDNKKSGIKNKLGKFKFIPKNNDTTDSATKNVDTTITELVPKIKTGNKEKKSRKGDYNDFMREDLKILESIPDVNDDFNLDLDFDWNDLDNLKQNCPSKSQNTLLKYDSESDGFRDLSQNTKLKWINTKFSSKKKLVKKLSDANMRQSITRSDSSSFQPSRNTIFQTSDEVINDLDLDI